MYCSTAWRRPSTRFLTSGATEIGLRPEWGPDLNRRPLPAAGPSARLSLSVQLRFVSCSFAASTLCNWYSCAAQTLLVGRMSNSDPAVAASYRRADRSEVASIPGQHRSRDPWLRVDVGDAVTVPAAGQAGHGRTASLRRQPVAIVDGRIEGGYTDKFELICPSCGDHPYLDYSEVAPRLQWLRGPRTLEAGLAAYAKHLGLDGLRE
jgi:hypothetical protein